MLTANVPYLEVERVRWRELDGSYVLADGRNGSEVWMVGGEGSFYLLEKSGFAGIVKTEQEDGVFCRESGSARWGSHRAEGNSRKRDKSPSLLVAWRYMDLKRWYIVWRCTSSVRFTCRRWMVDHSCQSLASTDSQISIVV